jgi:hypothetical protein
MFITVILMLEHTFRYFNILPCSSNKWQYIWQHGSKLKVWLRTAYKRAHTFGDTVDVAAGLLTPTHSAVIRSFEHIKPLQFPASIISKIIMTLGSTPSGTSAFDLTTEAGVEAYLATTRFPCTKAEALPGGISNFVFRLHLRQPHEGKNTLVLKHGKPYMKNRSTVPFDVKRQVDNVQPNIELF